MATLQVLQHLYSLDTSSPDLPRLLDGLIWHDERDQYLSTLHGSELVRLVDFLDKVGALPSAILPGTKQTFQVLGVIPNTDEVSRRCYHKLQVICGHHTILPSSYTISGHDLTRASDRQRRSGGSADLWEGTYEGGKVCVKELRVSLDASKILTKVRIQYRRVFFLSIEERPRMPVIHQRGPHMEKVEAPKRRPFHRCYSKTLTNCIGVDAEWDADDVRRWK